MKKSNLKKSFKLPLLLHLLIGLTGLLITTGLAPQSALAEAFSSAPLQLLDSNGSCQPSTEICGDDIDQDCDQKDLLCPGPDKDRDGFVDSQDCDDERRWIFPGVQLGCKTAGGESGVKSCQSDGTYSACTSTPLCEASGSGTCYYISCATGNDANAGTFANPWASFRKITFYGDPGMRPAGWKQLKAGDVVYFLDGVCRDVYDFEVGNSSGFRLDGTDGTAANPIIIRSYPGTHPIISPNGNVNGIYIGASDYVIVKDLEISQAYGAGIYVIDSNAGAIINNWIHDTDGVDNNNLSGIKLTRVVGESFATPYLISHNRVHDNYDRTNADTGGIKTQNSRNMAFFQGGNIRVSYNIIFQTPDISAQKTGGGITYKHASVVPGARFEVDHNMFKNVDFNAIGSGTSGSRIHHNLIVDSKPITFEDFGGPTNHSDNIVEYNTMVGTDGLGYEPSNTYFPLGTLIYRNNIVVAKRNYTQNDGLHSIDRYGSNTMHDLAKANTTFSTNCYHNTVTGLQFDFYGKNDSPSNDKGGMYSPFSAWQAAGFDSGSAAVDPQLDAFHVPQHSSCTAIGWQAGW